LELKKGQIARALAGRDKNKFFIIMDFKENYAWICDGKRRSLEKFKKKNLKHLALTNTITDINLLNNNKFIRKILREFINNK